MAQTRSFLPRNRLDRATLARELGYGSVQSVARAHRRGTLPIPYVVVAGRAWYARQDVAVWLAAQRVPTTTNSSALLSA